MGRLFRFVVSGASVAELKDNMERALDELSGEVTTPSEVPQDFLTEAAARPGQLSKEKPAQFVMPPIPSANQQSPSAAVSATRSQGPTGVDSMGMPWDERIHSSNMGKSKDGSWRARRGVEPAYVKQVEHELIGQIKADMSQNETAPPVILPQVLTAPTLQALPPMAPVNPMGNVPPPAQSIVPVAVVPPPMAVPIAPLIVTPVAPPPPQPVTSAHTMQTFIEQFVPTLAALVEAGKLTPEYIAALKNYFKVEQIYQITDVQKGELFNTFCQGGLLTKVG